MADPKPPEDWFVQNAPSQAEKDWFADNAQKASPAPTVPYQGYSRTALASRQLSDDNSKNPIVTLLKYATSHPFATVGGIIGTAATGGGGALVPIVGAGLGAYGGAGLDMLMDAALGRPAPTTPNQVGTRMMKEGGEAAAWTALPLAALKAPELAEAGVSLGTKLAKVNKTTLNRVINRSFGATNADKQRGVVRYLMDNGFFTLGEKGPNALDGVIDSLENRIQYGINADPERPVPYNQVIAAGREAAAARKNQAGWTSDVDAANAAVDRHMQEEGLAPSHVSVPYGPTTMRSTVKPTSGWENRKVQLSPVRGVYGEELRPALTVDMSVPKTEPIRTEIDPMTNSPRLATEATGTIPGGTNRVEVGGSRVPRGAYGEALPNPDLTMPGGRLHEIRAGEWGYLRPKAFGREVLDAEVDARLAMNSARAKAEAEAYPEVGSMLKDQGRAIGAKSALDEMRWRWGRNNPVDLPLAAANPSWMKMLTLINKPIVGVPAANAMYRAGRAAGNVMPTLSGDEFGNLVRSFLVEKLGYDK